MIDLRPCPFCGNNVRLEDREFDDFAGSFFTNTMSVIECEKCGISMKRYPKRGYGTTDEQKQDLINSWNRRTELMLKEKMKWIPVNEKLPKKPDAFPKCELRRTYFLVSLKSGCVESLGFDFDNNRWHTTGSPVVAWMELPEPYTEGW